MRFRILATLLVAGALAVLTAVPAYAANPILICNSNGPSSCLGFQSAQVGNEVFTVDPSQSRNLYWHQAGVDDNGYAYGYWESYNGLPIAEAGCNTVSSLLLADSTSDTGVVWVIYNAGLPSGETYIVNRHCSGGADQYGCKMADLGSPGFIEAIDCNNTSGFYRKKSLI